MNLPKPRTVRFVFQELFLHAGSSRKLGWNDESHQNTDHCEKAVRKLRLQWHTITRLPEHQRNQNTKTPNRNEPEPRLRNLRETFWRKTHRDERFSRFKVSEHLAYKLTGVRVQKMLVERILTWTHLKGRFSGTELAILSRPPTNSLEIDISGVL